jgi:hypothetical protein
MKTAEEVLLDYRHALRNALAIVGVRSNMGSSDEEILDEVVRKLTGMPVLWLRCEKCNKRFPGEGSLKIHQMSHEVGCPSGF